MSPLMLHFFVEEESAEAALIELVPRILPQHKLDYDFDVFPISGKLALLRNLPNRLKAYKHRVDDWRVIVLVDRDNEDCLELKGKLESIATEAGLTTRTQSPDSFQVINRIVVEELEAWFFGDVEAICQAYPSVDPNLAKKVAYRDPDAIEGGTWERLETVLEKDHEGGLEKVRAAQEIAKHMQPERNRSKSFQVFRDALLSLFPDERDE